MKLTKYIASVLLLMGVMFGQTKVFNIPIANFKNVVTVDDSLNVTGIASLNGGLILGNSSITGPATLTLGTTTTFDMGAVTTLDFDGAFAVTGGAMTASAGVTVDNIVINADALTSSNNLITIDGGTAGVRLNDFIGIGVAPSNIYALMIGGSRTSASGGGAGVQLNVDLTATANSDFLSQITSANVTYTDGGYTGLNASLIRLKGSSITKSGVGTISDASSLYIIDAPTVGTNNYSIFVDAGDSRFDGNLEVQSSLDLSGANAGQIQFPASQNASADANTLDDYEESTWTATIGDGVNNVTLSSATGYYLKVGRLVFVSGQFTVSSLGSASGALRLGGLPFTIINGWGYSATANFANGTGLAITAGTNLTGYFHTNDTYIDLQVWDAATGTSDFTAAMLSADGSFMVSGVYVTAN